MSCGIVVCSNCKREVHMEDRLWSHCEDGTSLCAEASAVYPRTHAAIQGKWCGRDDLSFWRNRRGRIQPNNPKLLATSTTP
jgi:hypothetical protein